MRAIFRKEFPNDFLMRIRMRHFPKIVSAWDIRMSQVSEWEARMGFAQSSRGGFLKPDKQYVLRNLNDSVSSGFKIATFHVEFQ